MMSEEKSLHSPYAIPVAILVSGLLIAGAIIFSGGGAPAATQTAGTLPSSTAGNMAPITEDDHIFGSADAKVVVVEYSDLECPFCKRFHGTMLQVMDEYGEGEVAWVYRHFPLTSLHSKAPKAAEASECAAELAGNEGFWQYVTRYFAVTPSNDEIDTAQFPQIAVDVGLDRAAFEECLASGKYAGKVESHYNDAIASGGEGTPYSVLVSSDGTRVPVSGSVPFEQLKSTIDALLERQ